MRFDPSNMSEQIAENASYDLGLRQYMVAVYRWMCAGLMITAITSYMVVHTPLARLFFNFSFFEDGGYRLNYTALGMIIAFSPIVFVWILSFGIARLSYRAAQGLFVVYSALMGMSLSILLLVYTGASIVQTFLTTSILFLSMSLWGYVTKRSLMGLGSFLFVGLIGLIIASLVNFFTHSSGMSFLISCFGVLIFVGFTAYDTQRIKFRYQAYLSSCDEEERSKQSVYDALSIYLNFINLFNFLLSLTGSTRSDSK